MRLFVVLALVFWTGCSSLPPGLAMDPALEGRWVYTGAVPATDPDFPFTRWPDAALTIDARRGLWTSTAAAGKKGVLPPASRVVAVEGSVLTLVPLTGGGPFSVYYRLTEGRLEFWWGDHPDWKKPYLVYRRP